MSFHADAKWRSDGPPRRPGPRHRRAAKSNPLMWSTFRRRPAPFDSAGWSTSESPQGSSRTWPRLSRESGASGSAVDRPGRPHPLRAWRLVTPPGGNPRRPAPHLSRRCCWENHMSFHVDAKWRSGGPPGRQEPRRREPVSVVADCGGGAKELGKVTSVGRGGGVASARRESRGAVATHVRDVRLAEPNVVSRGRQVAFRGAAEPRRAAPHRATRRPPSPPCAGSC